MCGACVRACMVRRSNIMKCVGACIGVGGGGGVVGFSACVCVCLCVCVSTMYVCMYM